ncbi:hypothetical protein L9F63_007765, partial [Diploptera punctata]
SGYKNQGSRSGQQAVASVLDSVQMDMANTSDSHLDAAQSSSGPASLVTNNYTNSPHTKTGSDVHLTTPKVSLGGSRSGLNPRQTIALRRHGQGPATTPTSSHLKHSSSEWVELHPRREERLWAFNNLLQQLQLPPISDEGENSPNTAILVTRLGKVSESPGNMNRDRSPSPPRHPPVSQSSYMQVSRDPVSPFSWTPPRLVSLRHTQREMGLPRHNEEGGNLPEKEDHKQKKDGSSSEDRSS